MVCVWGGVLYGVCMGRCTVWRVLVCVCDQMMSSCAACLWRSRGHAPNPSPSAPVDSSSPTLVGWTFRRGEWTGVSQPRHTQCHCVPPLQGGGGPPATRSAADTGDQAFGQSQFPEVCSRSSACGVCTFLELFMLREWQCLFVPLGLCLAGELASQHTN